MELGLYTFAELPPGGSATRRMRELVEEAERTSRIRLTSAVSVLGSDDPVLRAIELFGTAVAPAVRQHAADARD